MPLIKLNATQALTGALPAVSGANLTGVSAGKVLQVVSTTKTDTTSTSSSSYVDISGMSLSITPASSSNKIFALLIRVLESVIACLWPPESISPLSFI